MDFLNEEQRRRYEDIVEKIRELDEKRIVDDVEYEEKYLRYIELQNNGEEIDDELSSFIANSESRSYYERTRENYIEIIKDVLQQFYDKRDKMKKNIGHVMASLKFADVIKLDVDSELRELVADADELNKLGNSIIDSIDKLDTDVFKMEPRDINRAIDEIRKDIKKLKQEQQKKYNERVQYVFSKIDEFKNTSDIQIVELLNQLNGLGLKESTSKINSYNQVNYLSELNYVNLSIAIQIINNIEKKKNVQTPVKLESSIVAIEKSLNEIDSKIKDDLTSEEIENLEKEMLDLKTKIDDFDTLLELNNNLDEYSSYLERKNNALIKFKEVQEKLANLKSVELKLNSELEAIKNDVEGLESRVNAILNNNDLDFASVLNKFRDEQDSLIQSLDEFEIKLQKAYDDKQISDINKVNALKNKVKEYREKLKNVDTLIDELEMKVNSSKGYEVDFEKELNDLKEAVKSFDKSDKEKKKEIQKKIKYLDKKFVLYEKGLKLERKMNPDKYAELNNKFEKQKSEFNEIRKDFNAKCPLLAKIKGEATRLYRKHSKVVLMGAGIAAMALVSCHVLIPAIMHGNIMIAYSSATLRPSIKWINRMLGGIIGATRNAEGIWALANGVVINPSVAATSLLKGLAISGVGTVSLVTPVMIGIRELINKMKTTELKQKLSNQFGNVKEKFNDTVQHGKERFNGTIDKFTGNYNHMVSDKNAKRDIKLLIDDYCNSGKTLEEYAKDENLTDDEIAIIRYFDYNSNEYRNSGRKVR